MADALDELLRKDIDVQDCDQLASLYVAAAACSAAPKKAANALRTLRNAVPAAPSTLLDTILAAEADCKLVTTWSSAPSNEQDVAWLHPLFQLYANLSNSDSECKVFSLMYPAALCKALESRDAMLATTSTLIMYNAVRLDSTLLPLLTSSEEHMRVWVLVFALLESDVKFDSDFVLFLLEAVACSPSFASLYLALDASEAAHDSLDADMQRFDDINDPELYTAAQDTNHHEGQGAEEDSAISPPSHMSHEDAASPSAPSDHLVLDPLRCLAKTALLKFVEARLGHGTADTPDDPLALLGVDNMLFLRDRWCLLGFLAQDQSWWEAHSMAPFHAQFQLLTKLMGHMAASVDPEVTLRCVIMMS